MKTKSKIHYNKKKEEAMNYRTTKKSGFLSVRSYMEDKGTT